MAAKKNKGNSDVDLFEPLDEEDGASMQVQYLEYVGPKENGTLVLKRVRASSPWRKFHYYKGMSLKIGIDVAEFLAEMVVKDYKHLFQIKNVDLTKEAVFKQRFEEFLQDYLPSVPLAVLILTMNEVLLECLQDLPTAKDSFKEQLAFLVESFKEEDEVQTFIKEELRRQASRVKKLEDEEKGKAAEKKKAAGEKKKAKAVEAKKKAAEEKVKRDKIKKEGEPHIDAAPGQAEIGDGDVTYIPPDQIGTAADGMTDEEIASDLGLDDLEKTAHDAAVVITDAMNKNIDAAKKEADNAKGSGKIKRR